MVVLELRREKRFEVAAPVDFWWPTQRGSVRTSHGITRDIGNSGVLVTAEECPPVGTHIQMTIRVPKQRSSGRPLELHGEGTVVRAEEIGLTPRRGLKCFAASVQLYPEMPSGSEQPSRTRTAL
jgi:PilZ domain